MKVLFGKILTGIKNNRHPILKFLGMVFLVVIFLNLVYYFVSAYSPGCVVCHYMKPYYEQSKNSVHKDISCVTCHPGRRLLTAPYLLRYIAGSYNPRPRAEVDDHICLDCHKEQNLKKRTIFEKNISFNHSDHLGDLRRGKKLRCTSCHARGETQHFEVNKNVCFTCHFKGAEHGHSVTNCNVCHGIPKKEVEHSGFKFNHESYLKIGVDCSQCHLEVTKGNAEVEKKVCYKCHVERMEEFSNIDKIHNVHITKNGVDCEECHNSIQHGKIKMISLLEANCENCHQLKHSPQREMYIGSEGRGLGSIPSRMFAAQVSCEGCHLDLNKDGKSDLSEKRQACVKCHEKGYDLMLDKWISEFNDATNKLSPDLEKIRSLIISAERSGKNIEAERNYFNDAEGNFKLVKEGKGVHNVDFALGLLENVAKNLDGIAERLGNKGFKASRSKLLTNESEFCNLCHFAIPQKKVEKFGDEQFPHQLHMKFAACTKCHSKSEHKKITVTKTDCESCHKYLKKMPDKIKFGQIMFPHSLHSKQKNIDCAVCHGSFDLAKIKIKKEACTNCHHKGNDMIKDCGKCHPVQQNSYNGIFDGNKSEPDIMKSGGVDCGGCHNSGNKGISRPGTKVCAGCHDASYESMLTDWKNDIITKVKSLSSLVNNLRKNNLEPESKKKVDKARKLLSNLQSDGSKGIHNYMQFSSLLEKSILELNDINSGKK